MDRIEAHGLSADQLAKAEIKRLMLAFCFFGHRQEGFFNNLK